MSGMKVQHLYVRDRLTFERGTIESTVSKGFLRVRMDWGEIRDYNAQDLVPCPNTTQEPATQLLH